VAPAAPIAVPAQASYVDWPAILAGAAVAAAIAFILSVFGAAVGLSLTSPFGGEGMGATGISIAVGIWLLWVATSIFMAGGSLTGGLRRRIPDASAHEAEVRDGAHGLVVWAVGAAFVLAAALLIGAAGAYWAAGVGGRHRDEETVIALFGRRPT
jgi:hypothetical protein